MSTTVKSTIFGTIFLLSFIFFQSSVLAQESFEGKIVYTISYKDLPEEMKGYEAMLPKSIDIYIKGNRSRLEQSQMMGKNVVISDMDKKKGFMEMDNGMQKLRINISTEQFKDEANKLPGIEYMNESKVIAGYPCKKAIMKDANGEIAMTIYYTEQIQNKAQMEFVGLRGFPLEYSMTQQEMTMLMKASEISEQAIPDAMFQRSDGYNDISQSDWQKMMRGGQ